MKGSSTVIIQQQAFQAREQCCFAAYICCVSRWDPDNSFVPHGWF